MFVPMRQRTILDILSSNGMEEWCLRSRPLGKTRERTLQILCVAIDTLAAEGDVIYGVCEDDGPGVPLDMYLTRFFKYTPCKKDVFISSLVYLDRQIEKCGLVVNSTNVHRLFLICNLMAAKLVEETAQDFPVNNKLFSIVGGVSLSEINEMEVDFLADMDFRMHISPEEFNMYAKVVNERLNLLKEISLASTTSSCESTAKGTHHVYKQFTESIRMMERVLQQQS